MCCNSYRIIILFGFVVFSFFMNSFIPAIPVILWYIFSINIFTFLLFIIDKYYALKDRSRVSEMLLYFLSLAGGVFGAIIAMMAVKHKTRKRNFLYSQLAILTLWSIAILFIIKNLDNIQLALQELTK